MDSWPFLGQLSTESKTDNFKPTVKTNSLDDSNQSYIELDSSNRYDDIEILQVTECKKTPKVYDVITLDATEVVEEEITPVNQERNFNSCNNSRSNFTPNGQNESNFRLNNLKNRGTTAKSFSARGHSRGKKPYNKANFNQIQHRNKFNAGHKTGCSTIDYSYQQEILNSFLLFPIAADKLNSTVVKNYAAVMEVKKGLCWKWVQTEACNDENCSWSHEPRGLFEKKFHALSDLELINKVLLMKEDPYYSDALVEGFKELIKRDIPEKWIQILVFYIFTKTESLFFNSFDFWTVIAEYFSAKKNFKNYILGFNELISLFEKVKLEDRWRVIRFIDLIKSCCPDFQITYQFLKPILHFDLSPQLLVAAVESCCDTGTDITLVLRDVVSKINVQYLPLNGVETLLKFMELLRSTKMTFCEIEAKKMKTNMTSKILSLPSTIDESEYPLTAKYIRLISSNIDEDEVIYDETVVDIIHKLTVEFDFHYVALKLNEINETFAERVSEEIIKKISLHKFSPGDVIEMTSIIIDNANTSSAKKIAASMSLTLIYDYVRKNNWKSSGSILEICDSKNIDLLSAKIVGSDPQNSIEGYKLTFLLAEIYLNNEKYEEFIRYFETKYILSPCLFDWSVTANREAKKLKSEIIDEFFKATFRQELVDEAYELFYKIRKCQREIGWPIDLRRYINEIVVGLVNKKNKEALSIVKEVWDSALKTSVVRSVLIYMVQAGLVEEATNMFLQIADKVYKFPKVLSIDSDSIYRIQVDSTWSEEELSLFFNHYFYKLMRCHFKPSNAELISSIRIKVNIIFQISALNHDLVVKPWSLMEIDNSEDAIKKRVETVLENKMTPPLKTFPLSKIMLIESESLTEHLRHIFQSSRVI